MLPEEMKGKKIELQVAIKGDDGKETYIPLGTGFQEVEVNEKPDRVPEDFRKRAEEWREQRRKRHEEEMREMDEFIELIKEHSYKPLTPYVVSAQPLFTKIYLSWTRDPDVDHYEVYGSREPGFATTYSTLLLKSKTHEFVHEVGVNERWFYRVRAIGKNGKVSDFTEEVSAKTVKPWYSGVAAKHLPEWEEKIQLGIMQKLSEETNK